MFRDRQRASQGHGLKSREGLGVSSVDRECLSRGPGGGQRGSVANCGRCCKAKGPFRRQKGHFDPKRRDLNPPIPPPPDVPKCYQGCESQTAKVFDLTGFRSDTFLKSPNNSVRFKMKMYLIYMSLTNYFCNFQGTLLA